MSDHKLTTETASIVCLGKFNPSIFQPAWFAAQGLLREEESDAAEIRIVHPDIVQFTVDWLQLEVTQERLMAITHQESSFEPLRDLVVGSLELLHHTPTRVVGLNRRFVLEIETRKAYDDLGWELVPPSNWEGFLERPGMQDLTVQGKRPDDHEGYVRITVTPDMGATEPWRVIVNVNDHYAFAATDTAQATGEIIELLQGSWIESLGRAQEIADEITKLVP